MDRHLLGRFFELQRTTFGRYSVLCMDPVILHIQLNFDPAEDFLLTYHTLFKGLENRKVYCLLNHSWHLSPPCFDKAVALRARYSSEWPQFRWIHLCNEPGEAERLQAHGLRALYCSQHGLADEAVFRPLPSIAKRFDAVYDARVAPYKRHYLAQEVRSLALIYYRHIAADAAHVARTHELLSHAHHFNGTGASYRELNLREINESLNACRVGLCLSEEEGAMYASAQYLLSGLAVVTTPSRGGRELLFDERFVVTVPPDPAAVREGVREAIARKLSPELVRQSTLERVKPHRERFISLVQEIYDENRVPRRFAEDWGQVFFHTLLRTRNHFRVLEAIRQSERAPTAT